MPKHYKLYLIYLDLDETLDYTVKLETNIIFTDYKQT